MKIKNTFLIYGLLSFLFIACSVSIKEPKIFTIKFIPNKENVKGSMSIIKGEENSNITLPANTYSVTGYIFKNWNTKPDGSGDSYFDQETIILYDNIDLYAEWKAIYSISFNANKDNVIGSMNMINGEENSNITLPANTFFVEGYTFKNWNTKPDGSGDSYSDKATIKLSNNVALYAQWKPKEIIDASLSTEQPTNQNVIISVEVQNIEIDTICYLLSSESINSNNVSSYLMSVNTEIIYPDNNGLYTITASKNGYYTIIIKDQENNYFTKEIVINNIDKTAPGSVLNLSADYDIKTKKIKILWDNPSDNDFAYVQLSYKKNGNTIITENLTSASYIISEVFPDGSEYEFDCYAIDMLGNVSNIASCGIVVPSKVFVREITLNHSYIRNIDINTTVIVTVVIGNIYLLDENTPVKIQLKDTSGIYVTQTATVDKISGVASASISTEDKNGTYIVMCKIGNESADEIHTASLVVNNTSVQLTSIQYISNNATSNVKIFGKNLDLIVPSIQFYNSLGEPYYEEPIIISNACLNPPTTIEEENQIIEAFIPVPTINDEYIITVLFDGVLQTTKAVRISFFENPIITDLIIPAVDISKEDNTVTGIIKCKGLSSNKGFGYSPISIICPENPAIVSDIKITIYNSSTAYVTFKIPGVEGEYDITITYRDQMITGKLIAKDYSKYSIGDVFFNDGSVVHYDGKTPVFTNEQKENAIAVLAYFSEYGGPVGLGIHSASSLSWAKRGTFGVNYFFSGIRVESGNNSNNDNDGSDNWNYICMCDPFAIILPENYPAFYWVNNYANNYELSSDFSSGWYLPALAELNKINQNKSTINTILSALNGNSYWGSWSSSQYGYMGLPHYAWYSSNWWEKVSESYVRCVRLFE